MKILLIEDDEEKSKKLEEFISHEYPSAHIELTRSLNSGLRALISSGSNLDIVLLDMSLPTYDISPHEPTGGTPENFAGRDLLAQMRLRAIDVPTIIVTMFDSFGEATEKVSLEQLVSELKEEYTPPFKGLVYYNSGQEGWRSSLKQLIDSNSSGYKA